MITEVKLSNLRNGEFAAFVSNLLTICRDHDLQSMELQTDVDTIEDEFKLLRQQYRAERGSKITLSIIELDKRRDLLFVALRLIISQHAIAHPKEELRRKALKVLAVLERYGKNLYRKSYQEQTAGTNSILNSIKEDADLLDTLKNLQMTEYFKALDEANKEFDDAYLARNKEYSQMPQGSMTDLRATIEAQYAALVRRINAHLVLAEDPTYYEGLSRELDTLQRSYKDRADRRLSNGSTTDLVEDDDESLDQDIAEVSEEVTS